MIVRVTSFSRANTNKQRADVIQEKSYYRYTIQNFVYTTQIQLKENCFNEKIRRKKRTAIT